MLRLSTGVHEIKDLGSVVIKGAINCNACTSATENYTVIESVHFFSPGEPLRFCKPELWQGFEEELKRALKKFGEVEKLLQFPQHQNDTIQC